MNKGIAKIPPQQTTQHIYRPLPSLQSNNVHRTSEISVVSMIGFHFIVIPKLERFGKNKLLEEDLLSSDVAQNWQTDTNNFHLVD